MALLAATSAEDCWIGISAPKALGGEPSIPADGTAGDDQSDKPLLVPIPKEIPAPEENPTTAEKIALGRQLFFDNRLSADNSLSCASCHLPDKAFADGRPRAVGFGGTELGRNSPTVLNVAFLHPLMWDGRADSLEQQALLPIQDPNEMNLSLDELESRLNRIEGYAEQFRSIYGTGVTRDGVARSLAAFQRTLLSRNAPFDRYLQGDERALSPAAREGFELFTGAAGCVRCHHGPLLTDGKFYRLGVSFRDPGRAAITGDPNDRFRFRTPSLRDISRTGPYMHDGSMKTLEQVVEFYYRTVPLEGPDGLEIDVKPLLGQSYTEIGLIVEFLKSLDGELPAITEPELPR